MTAREVMKRLGAAGFTLERVNGSHHIMKKGSVSVSVPVHGKKDLKPGTLKAIENQSGVRMK